jgi:hypothetical protein
VKNQYFGDVNDFRKYGLLRSIAKATDLRIGIHWMLTENDGGSDGGLRAYLDQPQRWRLHDSALFDSLAQLRTGHQTPNVALAREWNLIPGASYFDELIPDSAEGRAAAMFASAFKLKDCDLVFLDPDNGTEVRSVPCGSKRSSKYVYWQELRGLFGAGHSVLVYQHYRREERQQFERQLIAEFGRRLGAGKVLGFKTPHVAFFLASQPHHCHAISSICSELSGWGGQCDLINPE